MRLIDADALRLMKVEECAGHSIECAMGWKACLEYINATPAIDAVPVVRCRDCKYSDVILEPYTMPLKCLNIRYGGVQPEWYCEHGERRDDDGKVD